MTKLNKKVLIQNKQNYHYLILMTILINLLKFMYLLKLMILKKSTADKEK